MLSRYNWTALFNYWSMLWRMWWRADCTSLLISVYILFKKYIEVELIRIIPYTKIPNKRTNGLRITSLKMKFWQLNTQNTRTTSGWQMNLVMDFQPFIVYVYWHIKHKWIFNDIVSYMLMHVFKIIFSVYANTRSSKVNNKETSHLNNWTKNNCLLTIWPENNNQLSKSSTWFLIKYSLYKNHFSMIPKNRGSFMRVITVLKMI